MPANLSKCLLLPTSILLGLSQLFLIHEVISFKHSATLMVVACLGKVKEKQDVDFCDVSQTSYVALSKFFCLSGLQFPLSTVTITLILTYPSWVT